MKLMKFWNSTKDAETLSRRNETLKRITTIEENLDEQLPCKKAYNVCPDDVNEFIQKQTCKCSNETIDGVHQCQYGCSCNYWRKTCSLDCACEGMCFPNTFLHLPDLDVRLGIAGVELYTEEDIDSGRLAFVFTGEMTSLKKYLKIINDGRIHLYAMIGRWKGERLFNVGKDGVPSFVLDTFEEAAGFANHSCEPNVEVFEIWQNGKLYIVGKTIKYCFSGDCLTYDYNWKWPDDVKYLEICLCGSKNCRGFIAKVNSPLIMHRSIERYATILNEMETHNIYESQRLDRLHTALHTNRVLTDQEKEEVKNLKQDSEELRLTKRKAIYIKKSILLAKAKLAQLEVVENEDKHKLLNQSHQAQFQALPDDDPGEKLTPYKLSFKSKDPKSTKSTCQSSSQIPLNNRVNNNDEKLKHMKPKVLESIRPTPKTNIVNMIIDDSDYEFDDDINDDDVYDESKASSSQSYASSLEFLRSEASSSAKNPKERCVSESRVSQALKNNGLSLSVRVPRPLKDTDECVLMGVEEVDKLITESKLTRRESTGSSCSFACLSPPPTQKKVKSNRNAIDTVKSSRVRDANERLNEKLNYLDISENLGGIKKASKGKGKATTSNTTNVEDKTPNVEGWGEGLFTQDEIHRIVSWIDGTLHARGESSQYQPWPKAKEWAFWLHKNFRHPTPTELQTHKKTWVGMGAKTLRAGGSGKIPISKTLPLVRDIRTLLSDVLTFIPYRFSGSKLIESKKSGNIWCIVSKDVNEPLPGNPTLQTTG